MDRLSKITSQLLSNPNRAKYRSNCTSPAANGSTRRSRHTLISIPNVTAPNRKHKSIRSLPLSLQIYNNNRHSTVCRSPQSFQTLLHFPIPSSANINPATPIAMANTPDFLNSQNFRHLNLSHLLPSQYPLVRSSLPSPHSRPKLSLTFPLSLPPLPPFSSHLYHILYKVTYLE